MSKNRKINKDKNMRVNRTEHFLWRTEASTMEMIRRATFDSGGKSYNSTITECVELGFQIFCEKHGILPSIPRIKEEPTPLVKVEKTDQFTVFDKPEEIRQTFSIRERDLTGGNK